MKILMSWIPTLLPVPFSTIVGYRPFVEACVDADEKGEALKYIPKLSDPRERAEVNTVEVHIERLQ